MLTRLAPQLAGEQGRLVWERLPDLVPADENDTEMVITTGSDSTLVDPIEIRILRTTTRRSTPSITALSLAGSGHEPRHHAPCR
jgi:hypothetical protein